MSRDLHDALDGSAVSVAVFCRAPTAEAVTVLDEIADELRRLPRNPLALRLSPVTPLPDGALLRIDDLPTDESARARVATTCEDVAVEAGRPPSILEAVDCTALTDLDRCHNAVVLRLFPDPAGEDGRLPDSWLELAADWVAGDLPTKQRVDVRVLGVELETRPAGLVDLLRGCGEVRAWCDAVTGDVTSRVRTASLSFGIAPHLALGAGGPGCDDKGLLARFDLLCDVARDAVDAAYSCVNFEETFIDLGTGLAHVPWALEGGAPPNQVAGRVVDVHVPDLFPFQVLGAGHHESAADPHATGDKVEDLGDGRWALTIEEPGDWLPHARHRHQCREEAWERHPGLLLREDQLVNVVRTEDRGGVRSSGMVRTEAPEPSAVIIDPESHERRGSRLTALEYASWLAGERHNDDPASVAPVLKSLVRGLGADLGPNHRQALAQVAHDLVGTGPSDDRTEDARCFAVADELVRVHAAIWLETAGKQRTATALQSLGSVRDDATLVRGIGLLGSTVTKASEAIESLLERAGGHADDVDAIGWDLWEEISARTGVSALTNAVAYQVPGDITFATDQRVMDCARDPDARARLQASPRGLGDEVCWTALVGVAGLAWQSAWQAAEEFVRHESTFSVDTTIRRSLQGRLDDADRVTVDAFLDDVADAAKDAIARLVLVGDVDSDHWERAVSEARKSPSGAVWWDAIEDARSVLGHVLFDDAVEVARTDLAEWARRSERLVVRAVVGSIAREACSATARIVISRTALGTLQAGGSVDEAEAAARAVVDPVTDRLATNVAHLVASLATIDA